MAAKKKTGAGYDFLVAELKKNPNAVYADLKAKAEKKGLPVYPIMFGRAKAALGLVKVAKRGSKKAVAKRGPGRPKGSKNKRGPGRPRKVGKRGPGRPRKVTSAADALSGLLDGLRAHEREKAEMRGTLEKIRDLVERALG